MNNINWTSYILIILILSIFNLPAISWAGGSYSEHYAITTSVFSGGGGKTGSTNFNAVGTLGQPSPLMDPFNPPFSISYDLEPGFWYTTEAVTMCGDIATFAASFGYESGEAGYSSLCDSDLDGDVDGSDLFQFKAVY